MPFAARPPRRSTLQENVKRLRAATLEAINRILVGQACEEGVDKGRRVRFDTTAVETNILHPSDSGLLWDAVRVLTRLLVRARGKQHLRHAF